jgi:hypothetical protein
MLLHIAQERRQPRRATMAKPYSILAAALVASGHSLSTFTVAGPIHYQTLWPTGEREDRFADSERVRAFSLESPFAMDPLAERAPANAAPLSE